MLHSSASFSIYTDDQNQEQVMGLDDFEKDITIRVGENKEALGGGSEFSFSKGAMGLIEEEEMEEEEGFNSIKKWGVEDDDEVDLRPASPPMYLAAGLGMDASGLGGGYDPVDFFDEKMVIEPSIHSSVLRNLVQSLWSEGKLDEAEEQCYQATLTYPEDGETLLQYAQLIWELHHDQAKASTYFELAAHVAPNDSNILGARAKFLWELEDDEEDETMVPGEEKGESDMQEYYEKMLAESPANPLLLKNYASFLRQSKVDLQGAEEYYGRAIKADPSDGEVLSEYAKLVWEFHHDYHKASDYFERAVEASPTDSLILGAYASFLWETDEHQEEDEASNIGSQLPHLETVAISVGSA